MLDARSFATELREEFARSRASYTGIEQWTAVMASVINEIAKRHALIAYGHQISGERSQQREYLWDYTLYGDHRDGALPAVVIEHENQHSRHAFREDFWKVLCAAAPLRVAIGYTKKAAERDEWIEQINAEANTGLWDSAFLLPCVDLIALGYWGMTEGDGNFACWIRADRSRAWTPLQFE